VDLLDHESRVKPLHREKLILQVQQPELDLLDCAPLQVEVLLVGRVLIANAPVEAVKLNLIAQLNQLANLRHEVAVIETLEGTPTLIDCSGGTSSIEQFLELERSRFRKSERVAHLVLVDGALAGGAAVLAALLVVEEEAALTLKRGQ
jgi:hypothetical protein